MDTLQTAEEILGLDDRKVQKIFVEVWEKYVYIRQMSVGQREKFNKLLVAKQTQHIKDKKVELISEFGRDGIEAQICIWGMCNESGEAIFKDSQKTALQEKHSEAVGFISAEILYFSGVVDRPSDEEDERSDAEKLADEVKN